jgi:hypothetical protein
MKEKKKKGQIGRGKNAASDGPVLQATPRGPTHVSCGPLARLLLWSSMPAYLDPSVTTSPS